RRSRPRTREGERERSNGGIPITSPDPGEPDPGEPRVAPLAAGAEDVEDGVEDIPHRGLARPPAAGLGRDVRLDQVPLGIGDVAGVVVRSHPISTMLSPRMFPLWDRQLETATPRRPGSGPANRQPPLFRGTLCRRMPARALVGVTGVEPEQDDADAGGEHQQPFAWLVPPGEQASRREYQRDRQDEQREQAVEPADIGLVELGQRAIDAAAL